MTEPARLLLTDRDLAILKMAYDYRGLTAEHVNRRFFPTPGARSACYARLARLVEAHYLTAVRLPAFSGLGSGKRFLTPGPAARPILAKLLGVGRAELDRLRLDSPFIIQHHLDLADVRLAFELACDRSPVFTLRQWTSDDELLETPISVTDPKTKKAIRFAADAAFTLALAGGGEQTFLLELDRGTLAPKRTREKVRAYLLRARSEPGPVLFVTPDPARSQAIAKLAKEEAAALAGDPSIFWLTTKPQVDERSVLDQDIWSVVAGPPAIALSTLAGVRPQPERAAPPALTGGMP